MLLLAAISCMMVANPGTPDSKKKKKKTEKTETVAAGNYSGIAHLHDDIYAVVSDKSDSALYFNFRILVNPKTGELEQVENLGFTERTPVFMPGLESLSRYWR